MTIALDAALSGLRVAQQSLDVVSNNIANAATPGFSRKVLPVETLVVHGVGHGVFPGAITRSVDQALQRDIYGQQATVSGQGITQKYLDQIQQFSGSTDQQLSLAAQMSALAKSFTALSDAPDNTLNLSQTLATAQQTATKFNDFSDLLQRMRRQTEADISQDVATVNQQLGIIADLNAKIAAIQGGGDSSADAEDQRDEAIRTVSKYLDIRTYNAPNGQVYVITAQGQALADTTAQTLSFQPASSLLPGSYYPGGGVNALFISGKDVTATPIGGELGALVRLRDTTLPTYNAQIDEMAQKLSYRMNAEGLRLFSDAGGNVPPNATPPAAPTYIGYAGIIQVNPAVEADPTLLRSGTTGGAAQAASNEVINRVAQYAFGPYAYQQATSTAVLTAGGNVFTAAGLSIYNKVTGNIALTSYTPDLVSNPAIAPGSAFTIAVGGGGPQMVSITPGDTAMTLVGKINAAVGSAVASLNGLGQLVLNTPNNIILADVSLGAPGIAALGLAFGAYPAQNPSFSVQVGGQSPVTFTINPLDTGATLLAQLNSLSTITASLDGSGHLVIVPKDGGGLILKDVVSTPLATLGINVTNIPHASFRTTNVGPNGALATGLVGSATLEDYARGIMTAQAEDDKAAADAVTQGSSYLQLLDKRYSDENGVNIDQELSLMIQIQSHYTAAARVISASEKMLDDLMNAI
jgi:flagellar hook-associated protein 1 FlgK